MVRSIFRSFFKLGISLWAGFFFGSRVPFFTESSLNLSECVFVDIVVYLTRTLTVTAYSSCVFVSEAEDSSGMRVSGAVRH